ncbi:MAG: arsenate reductase family protein [Tropicimonas sp.]|uniref:arsenate reductase family protein n=1 Tax=Tropicimonas sp. TaxID=2067044 RepID=UPI003A8AAA4E
MILYGIPTCDTCRKARAALEAEGREVVFRDLRAEPLSDGEIAALLARFGDALINRRSTTWRNLSEAERTAAPEALLAGHPTLMKRPVLADGEKVTLGWDAATRAGWTG